MRKNVASHVSPPAFCSKAKVAKGLGDVFAEHYGNIY